MTLPAHIAQRTRKVREVPLHRFLSLEIARQDTEGALLRIPAGEAAANPNGVVHGGILSALLDSASYVALLPHLGESKEAVTHDAHVSILRPAPADNPVEFRAWIRQKGKTLVFAEAEAWSRDKLVATARITKSVIHRK